MRTQIMWLCILLGALLASIAGLVYLISRISRFNFINKLAKNSKKLRIALATILNVVVSVIIYISLGYVNTCVILIHLTVFWLISELVFMILKKAGVKLPDTKLYLQGIAAVVVTVVYMMYGLFMCWHVFITEYNINTEKAVEPMKIVQISDSHMGTTFGGEGFAEHVETINKLNPDIVFITGDYIDGSSRYEDIITATKALGTLSPKYGVYFVFGNHDKNYYGEEERRDFSTDDLMKELNDNGVIVLQDEIVELENGYTIIGRQDLTEHDRLPISQLVEGLNADTYMIDLNHQPNDYANEQAAGVDMVLSGHTHGGQFFPIQDAGIWMGANDKTYGHELRGNTNFIVSSGISDWALDFKTGCKSEIVVINVN